MRDSVPSELVLALQVELHLSELITPGAVAAELKKDAEESEAVWISKAQKDQKGKVKENRRHDAFSLNQVSLRFRDRGGGKPGVPWVRTLPSRPQLRPRGTFLGVK